MISRYLLTSTFPTVLTISYRQFPQANYNVALDEARRHMGHHELTSLLHQLTGHDSSKSGYTRTAIVLNALAKALGRWKEPSGATIGARGRLLVHDTWVMMIQLKRASRGIVKVQETKFEEHWLLFCIFLRLESGCRHLSLKRLYITWTWSFVFILAASSTKRKGESRGYPLQFIRGIV